MTQETVDLYPCFIPNTVSTSESILFMQMAWEKGDPTPSQRVCDAKIDSVTVTHDMRESHTHFECHCRFLNFCVVYYFWGAQHLTLFRIFASNCASQRTAFNRIKANTLGSDSVLGCYACHRNMTSTNTDESPVQAHNCSKNTVIKSLCQSIAGSHNLCLNDIRYLWSFCHIIRRGLSTF